MKFNFRLQKVLDYRIKIEEEKKNKVASIVSQINKLKAQIDEVLNLKQDIIKEMQMNFEVKYFSWASKAIEGIYQTIKNNKEKISVLEKELEIARNEYIQARKDRIVLEKIKEKKYAEYLDEVRKVEKKIIEEIAIKMWNDKSIREFEWT
ncbi:MAG TPA: flagellar export protein FliJ [Spirochaetota bacterium]|nr:flagellar export protein FliJ [Spirochaetota bacterium]HOM38398.1 flagellar export protein FliJ [Spirochaetota bacterium]HPQ48384.1 flagellar export protein FliJ [Spirochaetota bacterium]